MTDRVEQGRCLAEIEIDNAGYASSRGVAGYMQWPERAQRSLANVIISSIPTQEGRDKYAGDVARAIDAQAHMHGRRASTTPALTAEAHASKDREIQRLRARIEELEATVAYTEAERLAWPKAADAVRMKETITGAHLIDLSRECALRMYGRYGAQERIKISIFDEESQLAIRTYVSYAFLLAKDLGMPVDGKVQPKAIAAPRVTRRKLELD